MMALFWHRHQSMKREAESDAATTVDVEELKEVAHQTAVQADKDIRKLNRLLKANGITLKIYHASGHK